MGLWSPLTMCPFLPEIVLNEQYLWVGLKLPTMVYIDIYIYVRCVNYNDLLPQSPGNDGFYREIIPFYDRKIQASDLL